MQSRLPMASRFRYHSSKILIRFSAQNFGFRPNPLFAIVRSLEKMPFRHLARERDGPEEVGYDAISIRVLDNHFETLIKDSKIQCACYILEAIS